MESAATRNSVSDSPSALQTLVDRFSDIPDFRCGNANQEHLLLDIW